MLTLPPFDILKYQYFHLGGDPAAVRHTANNWFQLSEAARDAIKKHLNNPGFIGPLGAGQDVSRSLINTGIARFSHAPIADEEIISTSASVHGVDYLSVHKDIISRGVDGSVIVYPNGVPTGTTRYRINDGSQLVKEGTRKTLYKPIAPQGTAAGDQELSVSYDSATDISTTEILRADGTVVAKTRVGSPAPELGGEVAAAKNPVPSLLPWDEIDAKLKGIKATIDPLPSILGGAASAEIKPENIKKLGKVAGRVGFVGDVLTLAAPNLSLSLLATSLVERSAGLLVRSSGAAAGGAAGSVYGGIKGRALTAAIVNGDIEEATELLIVPGSPLIDVDKISDSTKEK